MSPAENGRARAVALDHLRDHVNRGHSRIASLLGLPLEVRSAGALVYDEEDTAYLDCGGYGVFLLGHRHPDVVDAVAGQLGRHPLPTRALIEPNVAAAAQALTSVAPAGLQYAFFVNSGTESVELAIKLARANGCRRVIAAEGGFHGKTLGALSATGNNRYRAGLEPLLPGVEFVPFGDAEALKAALASDATRACVLLEPVQAEGGVRLPPAGYLRQVRELCDAFHALLAMDEIQSGLGRLGSWWGCDEEDVRPDVLTTGKVLSGGVVPVAATLATPEVYEVLNQDPLLHSSTYGGNPLAAVAAATTIDVLRRDRLVERARTLGGRLLPQIIDALAAAGPTLVREVRGRGLLIGIEFTSEASAGLFLTHMLRERVLTSYTLNASRVIRLTPPAILEPDHVCWLLRSLERSAVALAGG
ncbi:aspartate aminotransferase family protein [Streptomyces noursei]|uniref:aspartate aminotransferase family protein n=1 Tax=Streptomyces noursei TaxID=1971 RepID=UPI0016787835|nr:aminotransferase class III-fold pyridoxal phosphate-dependent enzyme [Streptomyces noursei]MCZ1020932.1 aminotransferase class III-fold pyridoxal phosphate-dependent enzyme [Streptomyces noursei]GGX35096.1 aminotransferase [Streptomyces noursei]